MSGLTKVNESEVRSSEGFVVKYGRESMTYVEGGRCVVIPVEHLGGPYELKVHLNSAGGWMTKGRSAGDLDAVQRQVLRERIEACLKHLNRNFSVES